MEEATTGIITLKSPYLCASVIEIDGVRHNTDSFLDSNHEFEVTLGTHNINAGIDYSEWPESNVHHWAITWAWDAPMPVEVTPTGITIKLERVWHLLKPVSVEASIVEA